MCSNWIDTFNDRQRAVLSVDIPGGGFSKSFAINADKLYSIDKDDGRLFMISSTTGSIERTFDLAQHITKPNCLCILDCDLVAISATNGAFIFNKLNSSTVKLCDGVCSGIVKDNLDIIALRHTKDASYLVRFKRCNNAETHNSWTLKTEITLRYRTPSIHDTLLISDHMVFISSWINGCVYEFNRSGDMIAKYGERGHGSTGVLWRPFLIGMDDHQNVLIAEPDKKRLQTLDCNQGVWSVVNTSNLPRDVKSPILFAQIQDSLDDRCMWILCDNGRKLVKTVKDN